MLEIPEESIAGALIADRADCSMQFQKVSGALSHSPACDSFR